MESMNDYIYRLTNSLWDIHLKLSKPTDEVLATCSVDSAPPPTTSVIHSGFTKSTTSNPTLSPSSRF